MSANTSVNRVAIKLRSSCVYVVSQPATNRSWACSSPGWKAHRRCKHLEQLGLAGGEVPFEVEKDEVENERPRPSTPPDQWRRRRRQ